MPYQPMHPPEKHVSIDRMNEILAKRTNGVLPTCESVQPLQFLPHVQPLEWEPPVWTNSQKTAGFIREVRGRYSISKDADATGGTYSAWKCLPDTLRNGKPWKEMPVHLGVTMSKDEAAALCQADANAA